MQVFAPFQIRQSQHNFPNNLNNYRKPAKMEIRNISLQENLQLANYRPIYSPRSTLSLYMQEVSQNKTNLIINIDKEVLSSFKNKFEEYHNKMTRIQFIYESQALLKSWQKDLNGRNTKLIKYLNELFDEASQKEREEGRKDTGKKEQEIVYISWEKFNKMIIEKALNLKSLQTSESEFISLLKQTTWRKPKEKLPSAVQKIICLQKQKKLAYLCEQSNKIQFLSLYTNQHTFKPIVIDKQEIIVQKSLVRRVKDPNINSKALPTKQNYKKDVVVSGYRITFLDMIYISNEKYRMLLTSSSDCIVRGWDIRGSTANLAKQPQSEQQKMIHQFPVEIHCMVWDEINQILYCSGKNSKIYLWMVKTDSERQLYDPEGHTTMISSMIMMPKLQFLASGGYDGKLILWDTIALTKKFKYEQHVRSIVSMAFHENLILLFTAAFDHSICVWNPYIPSLIYKIACNINVIQIQIIPGTNYLAALDSSSTLKIREVNKFTLLSSFVVDRPEEANQEIRNNKEKSGEEEEESTKLGNQNFIKIDPAYMGVSSGPVRFFFGGNSIKCLQFDENEALMASQYQPTLLKYCEQQKKLYVTVKNNILVWDILTGRLINILSLQTENQITAIDFISDELFMVGDLEGSLYIRKLQNGIKIQKLYQSKAKSPIVHLTSKSGGIWNESVLIECTLDCEINVFGKDKSKDYIHLRTLYPKKYLGNLISINSIDYEQQRNILIVGCNNGDLLFMDVDKTKVTNHIHQQSLQFYEKKYLESKSTPEIGKLEVNQQIPCVLGVNRGNQIFGIFLPPHSKKFKTFYDVSFQKPERISSIIFSEHSNFVYLGYENGQITKMELFLQTQADDHEGRLLEHWEITLEDNIKSLVLIESETIIAAIVYSRNITLLSAKEGEVLNVLPSHGLVGSILSEFDPTFGPVAYFNEETNSIFDIHTQETTKLSEIDSLRVFHDPFYLSEFINKQADKNKRDKKQLISNKKWKIMPKFREQTERNIKNILQIQQELSRMREDMPKIKLHKKMSFTESIEKAQKLQNRWEKTKQQEDQKNIQNLKLLKMQSFGLKTLKPSEKKIKYVHKNKEDAIKGDGGTQNKSYASEFSNLKHKSLHKVESSPLFKLGLALKKIDDKDYKANKFMEMALTDVFDSKQKKNVKFPKIK